MAPRGTTPERTRLGCLPLIREAYTVDGPTDGEVSSWVRLFREGEDAVLGAGVIPPVMTLQRPPHGVL